MTGTKTHWYHCSTTDHGDRWVAGRHVPLYPGRNERPVPRLCVCRSVAGCLAARLFFRGSVYVYRTEVVRAGVKPIGVFDAAITGERWLVPPVSMVRVGVIPAADVAAIQRDVVDYIRVNRTSSYYNVVQIFERAIPLCDRFDPSWVVPTDRKFVRSVVLNPEIMDIFKRNHEKREIVDAREAEDCAVHAQ